MNTTPLKDEMAAWVAHLDAPVSMRQAVDGKIRATKRRRAGTALAGAGAVAALCAFAVIGTGGGGAPTPLVPAGTVGSAAPSTGASTDRMPYRIIAPSPDDVVRDGLRYRAQVADDRLAVAGIGTVGEGKVTMTWTPTSTHVTLAAECWLPSADPKSPVPETAFLLIDGKRTVGRSCAPGPALAGALTPAGATLGEPGQGWDGLTIGKPVTVTVEAFGQNGLPVIDPAIRVAGAVYVQGAQRNVTDKSTGKVVAQVPEVTEYGGYRYRLTSLTTKPATGGPASARTPSQTPFLVTYGSAGLDPESGAAADAGRDYLIGLDASTGGNSGGIRVNVSQPARAAGSVTLRHEGAKPKRGVQLIAIYTPTD